jgi:hypothetical protein
MRGMALREGDRPKSVKVCFVFLQCGQDGREKIVMRPILKSLLLELPPGRVVQTELTEASSR